MAKTTLNQLYTKRHNCVRAIKVATNGLLTACQASGRYVGGEAAIRAISDRTRRIVELEAKLQGINLEIKNYSMKVPA